MAKTALVLGGGGALGIAWETGVLAGLQHSGVDVTGADLLVGTSAGSVVASHGTRRPITAEAGLRQGAELARSLEAAWSKTPA